MFKKIAQRVLALTVVVAALSFAVPSLEAAAGGDMNSWKRAVAKKVSKKQVYPRSAISKEIEGRAKVRLTVDATGAITAHEIVLETGEAVLDREIPKLVKRLNPLPALPEGRETLSFVLPLNWTLN